MAYSIIIIVDKSKIFLMGFRHGEELDIEKSQEIDMVVGCIIVSCQKIENNESKNFLKSMKDYNESIL